MRLLKRYADGSVLLTDDLVGAEIPEYAILSHTWSFDSNDEVTLQDITLRPELALEKPGCEKIKFCALQAARDGIDHFWVDTCCIDKTNHVELSEALNSMYRWYAKAKKCYVFMADVEHTKDNWKQFKRSRWFRRGWTLQELLAPAPDSIEFYTNTGEKLGTKASLETLISRITGIPIGALRGAPLSMYTIDERMRWQEHRQTKREEDYAYCMLGMFGVFLSFIYGEGKEHALRRLRRELDGQLPVRSRSQAHISTH